MSGPKVKPLRHSVGCGYARGKDTRQRIIESALEIFGAHGFDAATTRQIAQCAGVNPPALQYYFENKEGLYLACVNSTLDESLPLFQPLFERIDALEDNASDNLCIDLFCQLMDAMLDRIFGVIHSPNVQLFHARIQLGQGPADAFTLVRQRLSRNLHQAGAQLVSRLSRTSADDEQTHLRVMSLFGQVIMFHIMRRSVLDQLNWEGVNAEKLAVIKQMVREHSTTLLRSWRPGMTHP